MLARFSRPTHRFAGLPLLAGLLLALALGGPGGPAQAPAEAAPVPQETLTNLRFYLNVEQPAKYCVGQDYPIQVTPLVEVSGVTADGRRFTDSDRVVTGVTVAAEIQDTNVARLTPATQRSGALTIHRNVSLGGLGNLGALTFQLHAQSAGTTNLYLTAQAPTRYTGGRTSYFGPNAMPAGFAITVVNCEYEVIVRYDWALAGAGFNYWSIGTMRARVKATDPEYYGGDGTLAFFLNHYDLTCNERLTFDNANHLTLHRNFATDQLELTFSMTAGPASPRCPNIYLVSNSPFTDPSGPWGGKPLTFPIAGSTQIIKLVANVPGSPPPTGWATITVRPVSGGR